MTGICDTCERLGELFTLMGRKDRNCTVCSADIAMITSLYDRIKRANRERESAVELESEVKPILERLLARCGTSSCEGPICGSEALA